MNPRQIGIDIETVPDIPLMRQILEEEVTIDVGSLSDEAVLSETEKLKCREGSTFLPVLYHKIAAISVALRYKDLDNGGVIQGFEVISLSGGEYVEERDPTEEVLLEDLGRILDGEDRPTLITWNGYAFDFAVIRLRLLRTGIAMPAYWDIGQDGNKDRLYQNYFNRYHWVNVDLMDMMAGYLGQNKVRLDYAAKLCGLPGKIGVGGENSFRQWKKVSWQERADYCDIDVLNTYLIWLRWEMTRGLSPARLKKRLNEVEEFLEESKNEGFFGEYLDKMNWKDWSRK